MAVDYTELAKKHGGQTKAAAPTTTPVSGSVNYSQVAAKYGGVGAGKQEVEKPKPQISNMAGGFVRRSIEEGARQGREGIERIGQTADEFGKAPLAEKPLQAFRAPMQAVGTASRVAFSPLIVAIQDIADAVSDVPAVQRIAMSESVGKMLDKTGDIGISISAAARKNPQLAGDIQDFVDTITLAVGPKFAKTGTSMTGRAASPLTRVSERIGERLPNTAVREAEKILSTPLKRGAFDAEAAAAFKKYGIEPPVSAVTGSRAVQTAEAAAQAAWFGGGKVAKIVEDAQSGISKVAESLRKYAEPESLIKPGVTMEGVGRELKDALTKVRDEFDSAKAKIYDDAESRIGNQQAVLENTRQALTEMVTELRRSVVPTSQREATYFENILNALSTAERRTFSTVKQTRTDIGKAIGRARRGGTDPIESSDIGRLKRLYSALSKDLDRTVSASGRESANALRAADAFYKAGIQKINSFTGRTIHNARNPERIFGSLIKAGDASTVRELKALVGDDAFQSVSDAFMNSIVQGAIVPITGKLNPSKLATLLAKYGDDTIRELVGERGLQQLRTLLRSSIADDIIEKGTLDGRVQPGRIAAAIEKYDEKVLKQAFGEEYTKLQDLKKMANAMGKGTKIVSGSPTYEKLQFGINALLFGSGNIPILLTKMGIEWGMTKMFTTSWGRRLLTRGGLRKQAEPRAGGAAGGQDGPSVAPSTNVAPEGKQAANTGGADIVRYSEKGGEGGAAKGTEAPISRETSKKGEKTELFGAAAGIQPDEEGNIEFNPIGSVLGLAGTSAFKKLAAEARKYKTAEEFEQSLRSNYRVWHGTNADFEQFDPSIGYKGEYGTWFARSSQEVAEVGLKNLHMRYMRPGMKLASEAQENKVLDYKKLVGQGYRGVKYDNDTVKLFFPNEDTLTKQQLTDFFNKVKNGSKRELPQKIHKDDLAEMRDFTDYVNGSYKPNNAHQLELAASRIAEKYGIKGGKSNKTLSNSFGKILDAVGFDKNIQK